MIITKLMRLDKVALVILIFTLFGCKSKEMGRAEDFLRTGMYEQAISLLNMEIQKDPKNSEAHFLLGKAYLSQGDDLKAQEAFTRAILLKGNYIKRVNMAYYEIGSKIINDPSKAALAFGYLERALNNDTALSGKIAPLYRSAGSQLSKTNTGLSHKILGRSLELDYRLFHFTHVDTISSIQMPVFRYFNHEM